MTESSYPFKQPAADNPQGRTMTEKQWAAMFRYIFGTGVFAVSFNDALNQLNVTPDSSQALTVDVDTGAAGIQGFIYLNDAIKTITLAQNTASGTRADLIVLELKWGLDAGIHAVAITGDNGVTYPSGPLAGQPMPKELVTTYEVKWQIPLCQVNVPQGAGMLSNAMMIDQRSFVGGGGAQSYAVVVAMGNASDKMRQNADFQIPATTGYADADSIIMEAFDALPACGGTVMMSEGDCVINGSISPPANSIFAGNGVQSTISLAAGAGDIPMISISQPNVEVHHLLLDGGGVGYAIGPGNTHVWPAATNQHGVYSTAANTNVHDLTLNNIKGSGIRFVQNAGYLSGRIIKDNIINDNYGTPLYYEGNYGYIIDNIISTCGSRGLQLYAQAGLNCDCNKVQGNLIDGANGDGLALNGDQAGSWMQYNMVTNNEIGQCGYVQDNLYAGISVWGASDANHNHTTFIGNVVWTAGAPRSLYGLLIGTAHVNSLRIIGNDFLDSGTGGGIMVYEGTTYAGVGLNLL